MTDKDSTPTKKRSAKKPPPKIVITERDVELVRATLRYRFLYTYQFFWLFPKASQVNLRNRLNLLFRHGYLKRVQLPVVGLNDPYVYCMTEKGAGLLAMQDGVNRADINWNRYLNVVTPTHIQHLLAINDVLISFRLAFEDAKAKGELADFRVYRGDPAKHKLAVWVRDPTGHRREMAVVPDAILVLQVPSGEHGVFFVEVDRGTMSTVRWQDKVAVYREYTQGPQLQAEWQTQWAIVLTFTTSEKRLMSIAGKTVEALGKRGYWFALSSTVNPETVLGSVWVRGTDLFQIENGILKKQAPFSAVEKRSLLDSFRFDNG